MGHSCASPPQRGSPGWALRGEPPATLYHAGQITGLKDHRLRWTPGGHSQFRPQLGGTGADASRDWGAGRGNG